MASDGPLLTQSGHHCRSGLKNQVQSNDKNRQTYHNKKNEGSDAVVPIERPDDEVSQRRRGEQKQYEYAKNRKRHRFGLSVSAAEFFCARPQRLQYRQQSKDSWQLNTVAKLCSYDFHPRHLRDPDTQSGHRLLPSAPDCLLGKAPA
ncbi:MAG: hypothetical protein WB499_03940 [Pseudolabrys sp.]